MDRALSVSAPSHKLWTISCKTDWLTGRAVGGLVHRGSANGLKARGLRTKGYGCLSPWCGLDPGWDTWGAPLSLLHDIWDLPCSDCQRAGRALQQAPAHPCLPLSGRLLDTHGQVWVGVLVSCGVTAPFSWIRKQSSLSGKESAQGCIPKRLLGRPDYPLDHRKSKRVPDKHLFLLY